MGSLRSASIRQATYLVAQLDQDLMLANQPSAFLQRHLSKQIDDRVQVAFQRDKALTPVNLPFEFLLT